MGFPNIFLYVDPSTSGGAAAAGFSGAGGGRAAGFTFTKSSSASVSIKFHPNFHGEMMLNHVKICYIILESLCYPCVYCVKSWWRPIFFILNGMMCSFFYHFSIPSRPASPMATACFCGFSGSGAAGAAAAWPTSSRSRVISHEKSPLEWCYICYPY